jgi:drug/metabolite transporter (DMT)-like permease
VTRFILVAPALFVVLWATGFIGTRYAMPWAEPFTFLTLRFALSALLLAVIMRFIASASLSRRQAAHAALAGMLIHGIYLGGVFWAIRNGLPAGLSALIVGLQPLVATLIAGAMIGERVTARHWAGLAIGFTGILMVLGPRIGVAGAGVTAATLTASVVAVIGISAGTVWQKRFVSGADLVAGTFWQYVGATLLVGAASLAFEAGHVEFTTDLVLALAWLVLVLSLGAVFLLMYLIREGAVSRVSSLFYLVPAVTALMAWVLFDETLGPVQIAGLAVTTFGVALAMRQKSPAA